MQSQPKDRWLRHGSGRIRTKGGRRWQKRKTRKSRKSRKSRKEKKNKKKKRR